MFYNDSKVAFILGGEAKCLAIVKCEIWTVHVSLVHCNLDT